MRIHRSLRRVANDCSRELDQIARKRFMDPHRGDLSHLRRVDRLGPAVDAIVAGKSLRVGRLHHLVDDYAALVVRFDSAYVIEERSRFRLSDRPDDHIAGYLEKLQRLVRLFAPQAADSRAGFVWKDA